MIFNSLLIQLFNDDYYDDHDGHDDNNIMMINMIIMFINCNNIGLFYSDQ